MQYHCNVCSELLTGWHSCLAAQLASWLPKAITSAVGNNSSTRTTWRSGESLFQTATCTSTKVRLMSIVLSMSTSLAYYTEKVIYCKCTHREHDLTVFLLLIRLIPIVIVIVIVEMTRSNVDHWFITAGTSVPSSVNGNIAMQWEWSNFDPS